MKAFLVGVLVIFLLGVLSIAGVLLLPLLLVLGVFFRFVLGIVLIIFTIWLIGKVVLVSLDYLKKQEERSRSQKTN